MTQMLTQFVVNQPPVAVDTTRPTQEEGEAALRMFFKFAERLNLTETQARALLGEPARRTYQRWRAGDVGPLSLDTLYRLGDIVGIYIGLRSLFPEAERGEQWLKRPNKAFGDETALDVMTSGHPTALTRVRSYIASTLDGW